MGTQHDDLTQFIGTIFAGQDGLLEVRAINATERRRAFFRPTAIESIQRCCDKHAGSNLYFGVATRASTENGKDANLLQLGSIHIDQDFKDVPEDEALGLLERFGFRPSVIVNSGNGMHVYYRLDEPFDLTNADDRDQARFLIHAVSDRLRGDKAARDLARILRVPGSLNFKYDPPRPVEMLHCDPRLTISRKELLEFFHYSEHLREQAAKAQEKAARKPNLDVSEPEVAKLVSALSALDPDPYEDWIARGMELHHHFQGGEIGFELWDQWSRPSAKYDAEAMSDKWASFSANGNGGLPRSSASLFKAAIGNGWTGYRNGNGSTAGSARQDAPGAVERPRPLTAENSEPREFPIDALGTIKGAVEDVHYQTQAPISMISNAALGVAALAVQPFNDVILPTGLRSPLSLYLLTIAESGERKSTVDSIMLRAVREHEAELAITYEQELFEYQCAFASWKKETELILRNRDFPDRESRQRALEELGPEPVHPWFPMRMCNEPTYEGLVRGFFDGWPTLGLFSDEGGQLVGGHAMSDEHRLKSAAGLSDLFGGKEIRRVRSGTGLQILPGRRLSLHLMLQPLVARRLFADPTLRDQGLHSRFLTVMPAPAAGTRFSHASELPKDSQIHSSGHSILSRR